MRKTFPLHLLAFALLSASPLRSQTPIDTVLLQLKSEIPFARQGLPQTVVQDQLGRPYCYVAAKEGGLRVFNIQNIAAPVPVKTIPVTALAGEEAMNLWQEGNYLYLALGNFFSANDPRKPGLAIVDVSDPKNAFVTDTWLGDKAERGSAFVTVSGNYAYLGAMSQGLFILNVAAKNDIQFVSQYIPDIHFPLPNPGSVALPNARGMAVRGDQVFLCYDAGGLRVIDVADKSKPKQAHRYINPAALGKQQAYNNIALHGDTAYLAVDFCGLEILDVSDLSDIAELAWWNPWDCQSPANTWLNSPGHSNQIQFDSDRRLVFLSTGRSELNIVDVSNAAQPRQVGSYGSPTDNFFTWGATLHGERVYLTYISSLFPFFSVWSGVKILDWKATTGTSEAAGNVPLSLRPNPFGSAFQVEFELPEPGEVLAEMWDAQGRRVAVWAASHFPAGKNLLTWEGDVAPGLYTLRLATAQGVGVKTVVAFR